jgi:hypothetical protein
LLSSDTKVELLKLFQANPSLVDSIEGVALRMGKTPEAIKSDVEELVDLGILSYRKIGTRDLFQFNRRRDHEIKDVLERYSVRKRP